MALRSEGQTLEKKKNIAERHAQRFFFSLQSVSMTLARRYVWSGTPLRAGLRPAAAHCEGLRPVPPIRTLAPGPPGRSQSAQRLPNVSTKVSPPPPSPPDPLSRAKALATAVA